MKTLFWNVDFERLEAARDADFILERVLERGRLVDVRWAIEQYGFDRLRTFFRAAPRPSLSPRALRFWRLALHEERETWPEPSAFRRSSSAPWIS